MLDNVLPIPDAESLPFYPLVLKPGQSCVTRKPEHWHCQCFTRLRSVRVFIIMIFGPPAPELDSRAPTGPKPELAMLKLALRVRGSGLSLSKNSDLKTQVPCQCVTVQVTVGRGYQNPSHSRSELPVGLTVSLPA